MCGSRNLIAGALALAIGATANASSVSGTIVSAARVAIYTGAADGTELDFIASNSATSAGVLWPQQYTFEMGDERYIYIVAWGEGGWRGLLSELYFNGLPVLSGDPAWEVYATDLVLQHDDPPPTTADVSEQIRRANRRFAWSKAARLRTNGQGRPDSIQDVAPDAAWMWMPEEEPSLVLPATPPAPAGNCVLFRISPNELWPEIELWHGRNAGRGPREGQNFDAGSAYRWFGGGSGGGGAGGDLPNNGGGYAPPIGNPFASFDPPNSASVPPVMPPQAPSHPTLPPPVTHETPRRETPTDNPPENPPENPPDNPPVVPEPASAALLLAVVALLRRR